MMIQVTPIAAAKRTSRKAADANTASGAAPVSKLDQLVDLLARPEGASIAEMMKATGWQAHSVRGALAGSLKRRGLTITSDTSDGLRRYRTGGAQ